MRAKFYGTRGSIATPGPSTVRYGGNTSCTAVTTNADTLLILDVGTGAAVLGRELMASGRKLRGHILITHTHWDHIQGLPFFAPLLVGGNEWDIYAPRGLRERLHDTLAGQMQHTYFPLGLEQLGATIRYHELVEGAFRIDDVAVSTRYLNHTALTLGYRLECDGAAIVYACDHEPHIHGLATGRGEFVGQDARHAHFMKDADLIIHDAQYLASEYPAKIGWGHSTVEYALAAARLAGAKRLALTHHDPLRTDDAIDAELARLRKDAAGALEILAAAEGVELQVAGDAAAHAEAKESARSDLGAALAHNRVLMIGVTEQHRLLASALNAEGIDVVDSSPAEAVAKARAERPSVIVVEDRQELELGQIAASLRLAVSNPVSLVLTTRREERVVESAGPFDDCLVEPFTPSYARARIRSALFRAAIRWRQAEIPVNEKERLETLRSLNVLDTPREERFDRITQLAVDAFNVPAAMISLVDIDRQWFKSVTGLEVTEGPRDQAFCAHAILKEGPMIVEDALNDDRFADNPLVSGPSRLRFYAGYPLVVSDGSHVGTICIVDTRPRALNEREIAVLKDLAQLAVAELEKKQ